MADFLELILECVFDLVCSAVELVFNALPANAQIWLMAIMLVIIFSIIWIELK